METISQDEQSEIICQIQAINIHLSGLLEKINHCKDIVQLRLLKEEMKPLRSKKHELKDLLSKHGITIE